MVLWPTLGRGLERPSAYLSIAKGPCFELQHPLEGATVSGNEGKLWLWSVLSVNRPGCHEPLVQSWSWPCGTEPVTCPRSLVTIRTCLNCWVWSWCCSLKKGRNKTSQPPSGQPSTLNSRNFSLSKVTLKAWLTSNIGKSWRPTRLWRQGPRKWVTLALGCSRIVGGGVGLALSPSTRKGVHI